MAIVKKEQQDTFWTHKKIVQRISLWLKNTKRYKVVMSELSTYNTETPDVVAWRTGAGSILIECKMSRSDFHVDKKKFFRRHEQHGMGNKRYFAAPAGVLKAEDMPEGWGLLEVGSQVREKKEAIYKEADKGAECVMLMSALRRLEISTAVYVVHDDRKAE